MNKFTDEQRLRLHSKLRRELGPELCAVLGEKNVLELMLNEDGNLWVERVQLGVENIGKLESTRVESIVSTVAALNNQVINSSTPFLQTSLPLDGSRFQALSPPVVKNTCFTIRKHASLVYTLDDYVSAAEMTQFQADLIRKALKKRNNLIISGGTGSGKTTLANAILHESCEIGPQGERYVLIEDTYELQCSAANKVQLHALNRGMLSKLCQAAMRLRPDRVVLGEVRGAEAYDLMYLLNSGHPGSLTTLHANSAQTALDKFLMLARESGEEVHPQRVIDSFQNVISIKRTETGRCIEEIVEVVAHDGTEFIVKTLSNEEELSDDL